MKYIKNYCIGVLPLILFLLLVSALGYTMIYFGNIALNIDIFSMQIPHKGLILAISGILFIALVIFFKNIMLGAFSLLSLIFKGKFIKKENKKKVIQQYFYFIQKI